MKHFLYRNGLLIIAVGFLLLWLFLIFKSLTDVHTSHTGVGH